jgi:hypothetical protein
LGGSPHCPTNPRRSKVVEIAKHVLRLVIWIASYCWRQQR